MGDYNIHMYLQKVFTDYESKNMWQWYRLHSGHNIDLATWPFLNHDILLTALKKIIQNLKLGSSISKEGQINTIQNYINKLNEDEYWVDITQLGDTHRREYNTVTEQIRYVERLAIEESDFALFGNVRKNV